MDDPYMAIPSTKEVDPYKDIPSAKTKEADPYASIRTGGKSSDPYMSIPVERFTDKSKGFFNNFSISDITKYMQQGASGSLIKYAFGDTDAERLRKRQSIGMNKDSIEQELNDLAEKTYQEGGYDSKEYQAVDQVLHAYRQARDKPEFHFSDVYVAFKDDPGGMLAEVTKGIVSDPELMLTPLGWSRAAAVTGNVARAAGAGVRVSKAASMVGGTAGVSTAGAGISSGVSAAQQLGAKGSIDPYETLVAAEQGAAAAPLMTAGMKAVGRVYRGLPKAPSKAPSAEMEDIRPTSDERPLTFGGDEGASIALTKNTVPGEGPWRVTHFLDGQPVRHFPAENYAEARSSFERAVQAEKEFNAPSTKTVADKMEEIRPTVVEMHMGIDPRPGIKHIKEQLLKTDVGQKAAETMDEIVGDVQLSMSPMARGTPRAQAVAKDFANADRLVRWQYSRFVDLLNKNFKPARLKEMWEAADEENSVRAQNNGQGLPNRGINRLAPEERAVVEKLHDYGSQLLERAKRAGMFKGEGLPYWAPRVAAMIGEDGEIVTARNKGKVVDASIVRDIRSMPLAMARLERAIAGRELVNKIKEIGRSTGQTLVTEGEGTNITSSSKHLTQRKYGTVEETEAALKARVEKQQDRGQEEYFTLDHPAFKTYRPRFVKNEQGKVVPLKDENGEIVFDKVPLYISKEFEGPLKAIINGKQGKVYSALMSLKGKTTSVIMYSPLIHNAVEWGRALPVMPGKVFTFRVYFEGARAKRDPTVMREAIQSGLVPIGKRYFGQDISGAMEDPQVKAGRSLTSKVLSFPVGLVDKRAGEAVKRAIDKTGDFYHNTLLWDRVGDLQMGLYVNARDSFIRKGLDQASAAKVAAHIANRYAGAIPNESMSNGARKIANVVLFSRSFTLGNLGVMKDVITGLPRDVQAQILRDSGEAGLKVATDAARKKAAVAFVTDIALMYASISITQDALDYMLRDKSLSDIASDYVKRASRLSKRVGEHPSELLLPFAMLEKLSSTSSNEPGRENRVMLGKDENGTAIYGRVPIGKVGEEFSGWMTSPIDMLKKKQGTIVRPAFQLLENDRGFGRRMYNPDDPGLKGAVRNLGKIVTGFMEQQVPIDSIEAAENIMMGEGATIDALKVVGPVLGITISRGAPGGPEVGEMLTVQRRHRAEVADIMPTVKKLIKKGHMDEAFAKMEDANMTPAEMRLTLRYTLNPGIVSGRSMLKFEQTAPDEEKERLNDMRSTR